MIELSLSTFLIKLLLLSFLSVFLSVRHSGLDPDGAFTRGSRGLSFEVVSSAKGFGVVFCEGEFWLDRGVVLVGDDFGELFLVVLELHFEGYFDVFSLWQLHILDSL